MEKYFTPPTQALELKELGFDEPCLASWNFYTNELNYNQSPSKFSSVDVVQLPTYSQAFGWFREKYKLNGHVISQLIPRDNFIYAFKIVSPIILFDGYDTHEEAELACIKKLIEIAKNQTHE